MKKTVSINSRRNAIKTIALGIAGITASGNFAFAANSYKAQLLKGNINHSVCRWTYQFLSVEELCKTVKEIGFRQLTS